MSIFDMFKTGNNNNAGNTGNEGDKGNQQSTNVQDMGIKDPNAQNKGSGQEQQNDPFAFYADVLKPSQENKDAGPPKFHLGDTISKAAAAQDFAAKISPEMQARLDSGEPLDGKTVRQLLNEVGRSIYSTSLEHQTALTDRFVGLRAEHDSRGMPQQIQKFLASNQTRKIPGADNPVVKSFLEDSAARIAAKYPDQTPEWVAEKAKELFINIAGAIDPDMKQQSKGSNGVTREEVPADFWDKYLTNSTK